MNRVGRGEVGAEEEHRAQPAGPTGDDEPQRERGEAPVHLAAPDRVGPLPPRPQPAEAEQEEHENR